MLLELNANVNEKSVDGSIALIQEVQQVHADIWTVLLEDNANVTEN